LVDVGAAATKEATARVTKAAIVENFIFKKCFGASESDKREGLVGKNVVGATQSRVSGVKTRERP